MLNGSIAKTDTWKGWTCALAALAAAAAAALLPLPAGAQEKGEPWEITTKMEMAGMSMPGQSQRVCIAKNTKDDAFVPKQDDCKVVDSRRTANKYSYTMECAGKEPSTVSGDITFGREQYDGRMKMTMKRSKDTMDMSFAGKRLPGECVDTARQQVAAAQAQAAATSSQVCKEGLDKLMWQYFFADREAVICAGQQKEFCARVTKLAQDMREPEGYRAARKSHGDLGAAFSHCGQNFAATTAAACKRGVDGRSWGFVAESCDDDVRVLGKAHCEGVAFSSVPQGMGPVCSRYASLVRTPGGTGLRTAAPAAAPAPAPPAPAPTTNDAVQGGVNALKKLLPF